MHGFILALHGLSCSEYDLATKGDPVDSGVAADSGRPRHDDTDTSIDDDSGDEGSGLITEGDPTYCTPFDDFSGWAYTGTGNWHIDEGLLTEGRNGGYQGFAYAADLGVASEFYIQVDTAWTNDDNDLTGLAWGIAGESGWSARWDDPQGDYGRHDPIGGMDVSYCDSGGCSAYASDDTALLYWPADKSFVTWSVHVNGADVEVTVDGSVVLRATIPEVAGTGPGVAGVYSNDNDGGVWFDNFCVWSRG